MVSVSGYITRSNLPSPLADLAIVVDPYPLLVGDDSNDASSASGGLDLGPTSQKAVWADSPFVDGKQLVCSADDNSTLSLKILVEGTSMADLRTKAQAIVDAVRKQMTFQVSITLDAATYTWNCYRGDVQAAFNQMHLLGRLPVYVTMPRDPTPVAGPF
jgi:hypothetical protein